MCIFIGPVRSVKKTRILVAPIGKRHQLTVYENTVETVAKNAMVLPVPAGEEIRPIDLSAYPTLWADCETLFPQPSPSYSSAALSFGGGFGAQKTLEVQKVGGYECSIVPDLDAFARLSREHFTVPANIADILKTHYGKGFSFLVCRFSGNVAGHPLAYTSARLPNGACFIPTRHAHGGDMSGSTGLAMHVGVSCDMCATTPISGLRFKCLQCHDYDLCNRCFEAGTHDKSHIFARIPVPVTREQFTEILIQSQWKKHTDGDEFDHTIYLVNATLAAPPSRYTRIDNGFGDTHNQIKLAQFVQHMPHIEGLVRIEIEGKGFPNDDYKCVPHDF